MWQQHAASASHGKIDGLSDTDNAPMQCSIYTASHLGRFFNLLIYAAAKYTHGAASVCFCTKAQLQQCPPLCCVRILQQVGVERLLCSAILHFICKSL
jgi:hypothetical protein